MHILVLQLENVLSMCEKTRSVKSTRLHTIEMGHAKQDPHLWWPGGKVEAATCGARQSAEVSISLIERVRLKPTRGGNSHPGMSLRMCQCLLMICMMPCDLGVKSSDQEILEVEDVSRFKNKVDQSLWLALSNALCIMPLGYCLERNC